LPANERGAGLPAKPELLAWVRALQDETLRLLANPADLPAHPLLQNDALLHFLIQEHCWAYEQMVMVLTERRLLEGAAESRPRSAFRLRPEQVTLPLREIPRGHYRVGADATAQVYDNERPPQAVQLDAFRIAERPVTNAEFLGFIAAGGYLEPAFWDEEGTTWRRENGVSHPHHWRQDAEGNWYGVGVNGTYGLVPDAPVAGVSLHEARAFAVWISHRGEPWKGAIICHEYQWEVARRLGILSRVGEVWDWCGNRFHPYAGFVPWPDDQTSTGLFKRNYFALRGGSLHTLAPLRRPSLRGFGEPGDSHRFVSIRLVFPPLP